jgi:hypothetical protein
LRKEENLKVAEKTNWKQALTKSALNSLLLNNRRITDGSSEVEVNPAYNKISDEKIFDMLEEILSKVSLTDKLREIEDSNRSKFGPRSIAKPWIERRESLEAYFTDDDYDPGEFDLSRSEFNLNKANPERVIDKLIRSSAASLPYMTRKGLVLNHALANWKDQVCKYPCVLYTRTQEQGKTRNVWGYPVSDTIWEQQYYIPILAVERTWKHRSALIGPDTVDLSLSGMLQRKEQDESVLCIDFSSYDASIVPKHSYNAFRKFASLFPKALWEDLYKLYRRFVTIGVYTPDGEYSGPHGVPSGSSFTNAVDSETQLQVAGDIAKEMEIQGDDGVYIVKTSELTSLKDRFKAAGLKVNDDKSDEFDSREAIYLQRYYSDAYPNRYGAGLGGVYSVYRALLRIKYLERWTNFKKMDIEGSDFFALRTIAVLENCKHHPAFEEIVRMAHRLDRKNLHYTSSGLKSYSKAMEAKVRAGVFNQFGKSAGIEKFETIKVLKTL